MFDIDAPVCYKRVYPKNNKQQQRAMVLYNQEIAQMTAINRGERHGVIVAREAKSSPKAYLYRLKLDDGSTASVEERTNVPMRHIGDEYVVQLYDDANFNVIKRKA